MPESHILLRAVWLAAALASPVLSSATRLDQLFMRDAATCGIKGFSPCGQSGLPDNFCCGSGEECIVLAADTTVLCCPKDQNCGRINSIVCDVTQQDPSQHPGAPIKTTALNVKLPKCGANSCCPFGYHCDGDQCVVDTDQGTAPGAGTTDPDPDPTASATTKTPDPTSTTDPTETGSPTDPTHEPTAGPSDPTDQPTGGGATTPTGAPSTLEPQSPPSKGPQTAAIVGGVVAAVVIIVLIIAAFVVIRHRRKQQDSDDNSSTSSFGNSCTPQRQGSKLRVGSPHPLAQEAVLRTVFPPSKTGSFASSSQTITNHDGYFAPHSSDKAVEPRTPNGRKQPYSWPERNSQVWGLLPGSLQVDHDANYVQQQGPQVPITPGGRSHHRSAEVRCLTTARSVSTNDGGRPRAPTPTGRRGGGGGDADDGSYDDDDDDDDHNDTGRRAVAGAPEIQLNGGGSEDHLNIFSGFQGRDMQGNRNTQWTDYVVDSPAPPVTPAPMTLAPSIPAYVIQDRSPLTPPEPRRSTEWL